EPHPEPVRLASRVRRGQVEDLDLSPRRVEVASLRGQVALRAVGLRGLRADLGRTRDGRQRTELGLDAAAEGERDPRGQREGRSDVDDAQAHVDVIGILPGRLKAPMTSIVREWRAGGKGCRRSSPLLLRGPQARAPNQRFSQSWTSRYHSSEFRGFSTQ